MGHRERASKGRPAYGGQQPRWLAAALSCALLLACAQPGQGDPEPTPEPGASATGTANPQANASPNASANGGSAVPSAPGSQGDANANGAGAAAPEPMPVEQAPAPQSVEVINLVQALGVADPAPVGVAVAPDTGERYVLDATSGLYRLTADGAERIASLDELVDPAVALASEFTDLAACGEGRLLLTARNDGFLFDLETRLMQRHFCYLPPPVAEENPGASQLTASVACDATRIFAQPHTFDSTGAFVQSEIGVWELETGVDTHWFLLPDQSFMAGGLTVWDSDHLLLGRAASLQLFDLKANTLSGTFPLAQHGVSNTDGLAYDRAHSQLLIADATTDELVMIPISMLPQLSH